jgi:pimeloyl-ACP methyl ester carboxylesterase
MTRRCFAILILLAMAGTAPASQPVPPFPATPVLPHPARSGYIAVDGVKLWYAEFGAGPPVMLVEGGLDTTDDWAYLAPELASHGYRAIVFDSRCQGRSTCSPTELGYRLMARDTVALMSALHVERASFIGYSDGGIIGLELAIYDPRRVVSLFAYGANSNPGTLAPLSDAQKQVEVDSAAWSKRVYEQASPTPKDFASVASRIERMWDTQPHLTASQFGTIRVPVWIVDGDRDMIKRSDTDFMARSIPLGSELILPFASHYALWQYPKLFDAAVLQFLASTDPLAHR